MDDQLRNHETSAARVATLPAVPSGAEIERRLVRRAQQRGAWMQRADIWATARAAGGPVVVDFPRDERAVVALGVPCETCLSVVYAQGEEGHTVQFGAALGAHWAEFVTASCGRSGL